MSIDTPSTVIIAGWYPDPTDTSQARWWDGAQWTSTLRPRADVTSTPPPPAPAPAPAPAPEPERVNPPAPAFVSEPVPPASFVSVSASSPAPSYAPEFASAPATAAPLPTPIFASTPASGPAPATVPTQAPTQSHGYFSPVPIRTDAAMPPIDPYRPISRRQDSQGFVSMGVKQSVKFHPTRAYTGSVWAIATMPIWSTILILGLIIGLGDFYTDFLKAMTGFVIFVVSVAFAIHDQKILLSSLHPVAASPWWMLLSPLAYLIARGVHVSRTVGHGWAPLIVFVLCNVAPAAAVLAGSYLFVLFSSILP